MITVTGSVITIDLAYLLAGLVGQIAAFLAFAYRMDRKINELTITLRARGCLDVQKGVCSDE
jgi:hypothetical protein